MCVSTLFRLIESVSAISVLPLPEAISAATSP